MKLGSASIILVPTEFVLFKTVLPEDLRAVAYLRFFKIMKTYTSYTHPSTSLTSIIKQLKH